jgi:peptidyl-prolyl cis-trans isomerase SurA
VIPRPVHLYCAVVLAACLTGCKSRPGQEVAATVNGFHITYDQLEKYYRSQIQGTQEKPDEEQATLMKVNLLRELIDNRIMLQRAERLGLMAIDADVDAKVTELKAPYTEEEFAKRLKERGMTLDELKEELRRNLSIQKLFNKEITSKISISDADVKAFYEANRAMFNLAEPQVHLAQILVTSVPDPQVRNLKNDKAQNDDEARKKIQMLEARLRKGEDFGMLAQNYSEDPNSAPNGGDLGFIPQSALEKADLELRRVVALVGPGEISPIVHTPQAYRIIKVISREPAGQREFNDPRVQQTIRESLLNRKDQLLKAAYFEVARNEAEVTNYLAQSIVAGAGKPKK